MRSFAPHDEADWTAKGAEPWLVCVETQRLHFAPEDGPGHADFCSKVESCRRMLAYARRNRWCVVHVHRRRPGTPLGASAPELRPIDGLAPLPIERVYLRDAARSVGLVDDPFWRDARAARGAPMLMVGHLSARVIVEIASTAAETGLELSMVEDAVWRRASDAQFGDQALPLCTLKRIRAMYERDLRTHEALDGRYSAANAR